MPTTTISKLHIVTTPDANNTRRHFTQTQENQQVSKDYVNTSPVINENKDYKKEEDTEYVTVEDLSIFTVVTLRKLLPRYMSRMPGNKPDIIQQLVKLHLITKPCMVCAHAVRHQRLGSGRTTVAWKGPPVTHVVHPHYEKVQDQHSQQRGHSHLRPSRR